MEGVKEEEKGQEIEQEGGREGGMHPTYIRCVLTEQLHQVHSKVEQPSSFYGNNFKQQS